MKKNAAISSGHILAAGRLPEQVSVNTQVITRRKNRIGNIVPDGIACPKNSKEIHRIFKYSEKHHAQIVVNPDLERVNQLQKTFRQTPVLLVKTNRLTTFFHLDQQTCLATFSPGLSSIDVEFKLRSHGFTLGHLAPFIDYATLCELAVDYLKNISPSKERNAATQFLVNASIVTEENEFEMSLIHCPGLVEQVINSLTHKKSNDALLTSVTIRVFPLTYTTSETTGILNTSRQKTEDRICFTININESVLIPANPLAKNFLTNSTPEDQQSLLTDSITAYQASALRFEWKEYEAELEIQADNSCKVYLFYKKIGSGAWLQMKFDLTSRESDVCHLMMRGRSDKDIARILNISYWTVRTHASNILRKLGITSRSEIGSTVLSEMADVQSGAIT